VTLNSLSGSVALVTGASAGIGLATAKLLSENGAHVFINGRDEERLQAAIDRTEPALHPLVFDVADPEALRRGLTTVRETVGRLDILVANVGQRMRRPIEAISREQFASLLEVNLTATYDLVREAGTHMIEQGSGRIVILSSIAAHRAASGNVSYAASKAAIEALVRAFAVEWGPHNVIVNGLAPGSTATETNAKIMKSAVAQATTQRIPLRRWGEPEEVAAAALFLCSPAASYVSGHVLVVDGGLSAAM